MSETIARPRGRAASKPRAGAAATKERILDSALTEFSEHGFDGSTMRDIAARAGVNHAMIRYYYATKEQLWRAAVTRMFERVNAEIDYSSEFLEGMSTVEGFKEFLRRYVRYCAHHPEHARLMVQESIRGGDRLAWAVEEFILPKNRTLAPHILDLIEAGKLPNVSPMSLLYTIAAACQTPYMLAAEMSLVFGVDTRSPEAVEAHVEAVVALVFGERRGASDTAPAPESAPGWIRRKPGARARLQSV